MPRGSTAGTKINPRTEQAYLNSAPPTPQALSAIARRLHLEDTDETAALLVKAITHNSFVPAAYEGSLGRTSGKPIDPLKSNEHLAEVGRSILGFVLSEYYGKKFPNLPTKALKLLMTAVTNTDAMESVGSEIGLGKHGVPIRYKRSVETVTVPVTAQARRHKMTATELHQRGRKGGPVYEMEQVSTVLWRMGRGRRGAFSVGRIETDWSPYPVLTAPPRLPPLPASRPIQLPRRRHHLCHPSRHRSHLPGEGPPFPPIPSPHLSLPRR